MNDTSGNESRGLLDANVNNSNTYGVLPGVQRHTSNTSAGSEAAAKKKKLLIGVGAGVGVAVLLLILILALGGGGDDPGPAPGPAPGPDPGPDPGPTPVPAGYNPYVLDQSSIKKGLSSVTGLVDYKPQDSHYAEETNEVLKADSGEIKLDPKAIPSGSNNEVITKASYTFAQVDYHTTMMTLTQADSERFSIPETLVKKGKEDDTMRLDAAGFKMPTDRFGFSLSSHSNPEQVYVSVAKQSSLLMMDKFMQIDFQLPSQRLFGFGERNRQLLLDQGTYTMWASGQAAAYDGGRGGNQTSGVHPFVLVQSAQEDEFLGIFFRNSNAQSPIITFNEDGTSTLSYVTTGGQIEAYFFTGGSAKQVIGRYHALIGVPMPPPFWALGWQAASEGYKTQADLEAAVQGFAAADLPVEGFWLGASYMDGYRDFSVSSSAFKTLGELTQQLHASGRRLIVVVDPGLSADAPNDKFLRQAEDAGALLQSTVNPDDFGGALVHHVYSNKTVFLDFLSDQAVEVWSNGLTELYDEVPYDGLWLDMNEVTGLCDGECPNGLSSKQSPAKKLTSLLSTSEGEDSGSWYQSFSNQDDMSTYSLPFIAGTKNLDHMTASLNATHPGTGATEYDVHSLTGLAQSMATGAFLKSQRPDNRTFVSSRSTFAGSTETTHHSIPALDNSYAALNYSIAGVMNFNMYGIPFTGADACTTSGQAEQDELCARQTQLAAFFPAAKLNAKAAESGALTGVLGLQEPHATQVKNAMMGRLQYLRHIYTCLIQVYKGTASTCFDPLFFHYPTDSNTLDAAESSFILGDALKVSPVLAAGVTTFKSYFPAGSWVSMNDYADIVTAAGEKGEWVELTASDDSAHVHLRPGYMVAKQDTASGAINSTEALLAAPVTLVGNRDANGQATGLLILDDGYSASELADGTFEQYEFVLAAKSIKVTQAQSVETSKYPGVAEIVLTNAEDLKDTNFACATSPTDGSATALTPVYDDAAKTLTMKTADGSPVSPAAIKDIYFGGDNDLNLCGGQFYKLKDALPNLSGVSAEMVLTSDSAALKDLKVELALLKTGVINVHWNFASTEGLEKTPFEVPLSIVDPKKDQLHDDTKSLKDFVSVTEAQGTGAVSISVNNVDAQSGEKGATVWELENVILTEYLNKIEAIAYTTTSADAAGFKGVLGLGQRTSEDLFLQDGVHTLWARDAGDPVSTGKLPAQNQYASHPFYMGQARDNTWFGVYTNLAAAQDWWIANDAAQGQVKATIMAAGGLGDVYFMLGSGPNDVTKLYHTIIGTPAMAPQWALGWGQSRWGYSSTEELGQVVANYSAAGLPLEHVWSDIDYLKDYRDFTYDTEGGFSDLPDFVNTLHGKNMKYVPILDAAIAARPSGADGYEAFTEAESKGLFIKTQDGETLTGQVWPGDAAFPDFFAGETSGWWGKWLSDLYSKVPFDGLWQDMNEAANFCTGACYPSQVAKSPLKYKLPYTPGGRDLEEKSLPLDAVHAGGVTELDAHSLFGAMQTSATDAWFASQNKRTFVLSRSGFAGSGKTSAHWLGDNTSTYEYMRASITGIMNDNIMGVALSGADICGFNGDTNPELCARWHIVGGFYPFSRNHATRGSMSQEPYRFQDDLYRASLPYSKIMSRGINTKYHLIRYYYTQLAKINEEGGAFFKPLFFEFPEDAGAYAAQTTNAMLGDALKLGVPGDSSASSGEMADFYFPAGTWCDVFNKTQGVDGCKTYATGTTVSLGARPFDFHLHLRAGYVVPMQDATKLQANTTVDLQAKPVDFHIHPKCDESVCSASGDYRNDDGEARDTAGFQNVYEIDYQQGVGATTLTLQVSLDASATNVDKMRVNQNDALGRIEIYNAKAQGLDGTFSVVAKMDTGDVNLPDATYDSLSDRLISAGADDAWLPQLSSVTFTKK